MNRTQLEHIIRAAAANADATDLVVIGSQAILGKHPDAPAALTRSMEADVFPRDRPETSILIDGAIGERSVFHETFGCLMADSFYGMRMRPLPPPRSAEAKGLIHHSLGQRPRTFGGACAR